VNKIKSDDVTEQRLAATLSAPAPGEPDLVIVLGSATEIPASLVWEIAYAELVYLDAPWQALDAEHLEMAIDDFARRDRRFGGIDS
jgi:undecaprenyl diphosphate synthase